MRKLSLAANFSAMLVSGCFSPKYSDGGLKCDPGAGHPCPAGYHCAFGNTCWKNGIEPVVKHVGEACVPGDICETMQCVDGYCCDSKCDGACQTCSDTPGTCTLFSGTPTGHRSCNGQDQLCGGTCDGSAPDCIYPSATTPCGAACDGHCDGSGSCSSGSAGSCPNGFACGVGACKTSCSGPTDCQTNFQCTNNACVRIPESDCLDGIDNNGDGLIDCADPSCNAQVTCVPSVTTPIGTIATSCLAGVNGTHINQGFSAPNTCHACGCTVSGSCTYTLYGDNSGEFCVHPNTTLGTFSTSNSCISIGPAAYFSIAVSASANATCGALQTGIPDAPKYTTSENFCPSAKSPSAAACGANQVCVSKTEGGNVCTLVSGTTCPGTYPTNSGTWYGDGTTSDTRSCTCSGCMVTSNGSCDANGLQWVVHTSANSAAACVDNPAPYHYCSGTCCNWSPGAGDFTNYYWSHNDAIDSLTSHAQPANTGATCNGGTGAVTAGMATPGTTMTVCCP